MCAEDWYESGEYVDTRTGDVWERWENGQWRVNGMPHKVFPTNLTRSVDVKVGPNECRE